MDMIMMMIMMMICLGTDLIPSLVFQDKLLLRYVCGTVLSMLSGLKTRSLGLNTLGTT